MKKHFVALLAVVLSLVSCQYLTFDDSKSGNDCRISGYAQKGQLNKGSQVTAFEIDANMVATGKSYPANITDALGSFSFAANVEAPYLEIRAEGYYFNEVTGENSEAPIYLEAIVPYVDVLVGAFEREHRLGVPFALGIDGANAAVLDLAAHKEAEFYIHTFSAELNVAE